MSKSGRRRSGGGLAPAKKGSSRKVAFAFEQGERTYPQPILTGSGSFNGAGKCSISLGRLDLAEDHLRGLGWRISCTIQGDGVFLTSTTTSRQVIKNIPYVVEDDGDEGHQGPKVPDLTLVGPPNATAVVVAQVSLLYKPQV